MKRTSDHRMSGARRRRLALTVAAIVGALIACLTLATPGRAAIRTATPATFGTEFAAAQAGDAIELVSGSYGSFNGGTKPGTVTIRPQAGASASMALNFNGASGIRVEGLTITDLAFAGNTRNVAVANSRFTGQAVLRSDQMVNANIVLDGNSHPNINVCGSCYEGRLQVSGDNSQPSGITIQNSTFGPGGDADGIQNGATGVQILNNEFTGIRQVSEVHTDSLQLYGARQTVIRGNHFHDFDVAIMAPDGGNAEMITDNVFDGAGDYRPAVQLGSHQGSQFVHNTVRNIDVHMDRKSENPGNPSRNGVIRDNVFVNGRIGGFSGNPSYCSNCAFSYNLFSSGGTASGSQTVIGLPRFAGGTNPTTWAGFALAAGSPGKGNASDGTDRGIRLSVRPPGATPLPPAAVGPPGATKKRGFKIKLRVRRRVTWAHLRRGLRMRIGVPKRVRLDVKLMRKGRKRALAHKRRTVKKGTRTVVLKPRRARLGRRRAQRLTLTIVATDSAGTKSRRRVIIRVRR